METHDPHSRSESESARALPFAFSVRSSLTCSCLPAAFRSLAVLSFVNSSSTVIAAALNVEVGNINGSTLKESPVLTRSNFRCTPFSAMVPFSTSG